MKNPDIDRIITPEKRRYLNNIFAQYNMKWVARWTPRGVRIRMRQGVSFEADMGYEYDFLHKSRAEQERLIEQKIAKRG